MIFPGGPAIHTYRDLADLLRQAITDGRLTPGEALPSQRTLRETHGLGKGAVDDAVKLLRHEGLIDVRKGYGALVRVQPERQDVTLAAGDSVVARMPTPDERQRLNLGDGVPVLHVTYADGSGDVLAADRVRIVHPNG